MLLLLLSLLLLLLLLSLLLLLLLLLLPCLLLQWLECSRVQTPCCCQCCCAHGPLWQAYSTTCQQTPQESFLGFWPCCGAGFRGTPAGLHHLCSLNCGQTAHWSSSHVSVQLQNTLHQRQHQHQQGRQQMGQAQQVASAVTIAVTATLMTTVAAAVQAVSQVLMTCQWMVVMTSQASSSTESSTSVAARRHNGKGPKQMRIQQLQSSLQQQQVQHMTCCFCC
jgi:hypothetical protein